MMKKAFLLGLAVLIMLALVGMSCDIFGGDGEEPDGPWKNELMTKGLDNFEVIMGENPGDIKYKFSATEPSATYTLYYALGSIKSALGMIGSAIALGQLQEVNPSNEYQVLTLTPSVSYSVVIEAKIGSTAGARSAVKWVTTKDGPAPLELTVTDIPASAGILKAYLLNTSGTRVAVASDPSAISGGSGKFPFYTYVQDTTQKGAAWTQTGAYYIELEDAFATKTYTYIRGQFNFDQLTATLTWGEFKEKDQLALLITDIPSGTTIGAAWLYDTIPVFGVNPTPPKAVGLNVDGVFKFTEYTTLQITGANFKTAGSYYIYLTANADGKGTMYLYKGDDTAQTALQFSFTAQAADIAWSKFAVKQ